jgi:hypothetical protein
MGKVSASSVPSERHSRPTHLPHRRKLQHQIRHRSRRGDLHHCILLLPQQLKQSAGRTRFDQAGAQDIDRPTEPSDAVARGGADACSWVREAGDDEG